MQININQEEAMVLLNALRGYLCDLRQSNEKLLGEAHNRRGGCCDDGGAHIARVRHLCNEQEEFCVDLRDKLKKHQMKFPAEEHKEQKPWYKHHGADD